MAPVRSLSDRDFATLDALADALIPAGASLPGASAVAAGARVAELIERMPPEVRQLLRAQLAGLANLSRVAGAPFSRLARDRRGAILAGLSSSARRSRR